MLRPGPIAVACLTMLAACASTYESVRFGPHRQRTLVRAAEDAPVAAEVELRVDEIRERERRAGGLVREVRVLIAVENRGPEPAALLTEELVLEDGDGVAFGPARLRRAKGGRTPEVAPGARRTFDVFFAWPDGERFRDRNLDFLRLAWALRFGAHVWREELVFERVEVVHEGWYGPDGVLHVHHASPPAPTIYREAPTPRAPAR